MTLTAADELVLPAFEILDAATVAGLDRDAWATAHAGGLSASEIAAAVGLSPWESPFSLHWRKRQGWPGPDESLAMKAGKALEPLITAEFADMHPELTIVDCGMFAHGVRRWQLATPDRLAWGDDRNPIPIEEKTSATTVGWGESGSAEVPLHYHAQLQWQMDVLHAKRGVIVCMIGHREIREYPITYDPTDATVMRLAGMDFLADVAAGRSPEPDGHPATGQALRWLHPDLEDRTVEIPDDLADQYMRTRRLADRIITRRDLLEQRLRVLLGAAKGGTYRGQRLVTRSIFDRRTLSGRALRMSFDALVSKHPRSKIAAEFAALLDEHTTTSTTDRLYVSRKTLEVEA